MQTVTAQEVQAAENRVFAMNEGETMELMLEMSEQQPYIQVYIAAILQNGDLDEENDQDALANLSCIVWEAMRTTTDGPVAEVKGNEIDVSEEKVMQLLQYADGEEEEQLPEMASAWLQGHNQRPLMEHVLKDLMGPESYDVTPTGAAVIFATLNVIIDCLDNAATEGAE